MCTSRVSCIFEARCLHTCQRGASLRWQVRPRPSSPPGLRVLPQCWLVLAAPGGWAPVSGSRTFPHRTPPWNLSGAGLPRVPAARCGAQSSGPEGGLPCRSQGAWRTVAAGRPDWSRRGHAMTATPPSSGHGCHTHHQRQGGPAGGPTRQGWAGPRLLCWDEGHRNPLKYKQPRKSR